MADQQSSSFHSETCRHTHPSPLISKVGRCGEVKRKDFSPPLGETHLTTEKLAVESAEVAYDADNRRSDLRSLRSWSDSPPDLQEHTDNAKGRPVVSG